jgi:hypothetical protein
MSLELTEETWKQVYNFQDTWDAVDIQLNLQKQLVKEAEPGQEIIYLDEQEALDEIFTTWCLENLLTEDVKGFTAEVPSAAWFSLIQRSYTFKNYSGIPVYFKINRAALTNGMNIALAAFTSRGAGTAQSAFPYEPESGFYYYKEPLFVGQDITITFIALILDSSGESGNFDFRPGHAEIIQATNNAVYMADGWKNFADELVSYLLAEQSVISDTDTGTDTSTNTDTDSTFLESPLDEKGSAVNETNES